MSDINYKQDGVFKGLHMDIYIIFKKQYDTGIKNEKRDHEGPLFQFGEHCLAPSVPISERHINKHHACSFRFPYEIYPPNADICKTDDRYYRRNNKYKPFLGKPLLSAA